MFGPLSMAELRKRLAPKSQEAEVVVAATAIAAEARARLQAEVALKLAEAHDLYVQNAIQHSFRAGRGSQEGEAVHTLLAKAQAVRFCLHSIGEHGLAETLSENVSQRLTGAAFTKFMVDEDGRLAKVLD